MQYARCYGSGDKSKVLICDSSKFSSSSAFKLFSIREVDYIITDAKLTCDSSDEFEVVVFKENEAYLYKKK